MRGIVLAAMFVVSTPFSVSAQETADGPIVVWHPVLAASIRRIAAESASWRDAIEEAAPTGRHVFLVAADQLKSFDSTSLAEAQPVTADRVHVDNVVVVINLELLRKLSGLPMKAIDFEDDVDRIVAHEIYGHAIPYLLAGTLSEGKCADPAVGQSAVASCAVQRENVIRSEMGLGRRLEYGRDSLALARRYHH